MTKTLFLGVTCSLLLGGVANAGPITWIVSMTLTNTNPNMAGTGVGSGSFVYNADTNTYSDWSILLSGFPLNPNGPDINGLLTPATSSLTFGSATQLSLGYPELQMPFSYFFTLFFVGPPPNFVDNPLTDSGGQVPFMAFDEPGFGTWSGTGTASSSPEPNPAVLVLLGGAVFCITGREWFRRSLSNKRAAKLP
jgi:hypothetical protein